MAAILQLHAQGWGRRRIAQHLGLNPWAVRRVLERYCQPDPPSASAVTFPDLPAPPPDGWDLDYLDWVIRAQEIERSTEWRQQEATVCIDSDRPIGVVFTGDWHIGHRGVDYARMRDDFGLIRDTDGLYAVGMGDYTDNLIAAPKVPQAPDETMIRLTMQQRLFAATVRRYFSEKALAWVLGNHDHWTDRTTGLHPVMELARETGRPYLHHGGIIHLKMPGVVYKIAVRHSFPGQSRINTLNNQRRLWEAVAGADVVVLGHMHFADLGHQQRGGQDTIWLRSGTYKVDDDYGQQRVGLPADPRMPMVVFWPDRRQMAPFLDFRLGLDYLQYLRRREGAA